MPDSEQPISLAPTEGLSYDPADEAYWDGSALAGEVTRAFEICHGCRMCFKYCDAFPSLFERVDANDGDVRRLDASDVQEVMGDCFQCKLCEVQCPYTPRDGHEFQLDFPKLVHRYEAQRRRREGGTLRDALLGDPDRSARMARASFGLANLFNRVAPFRWLMEKVVGVDRRALLPPFAQTTFERWAARRGRLVEPRTAASEYEAVLFPTCYVQNNEPQIGRDTLEVLDRNQVSTACVAGLECCGMPAWEQGDLESLRAAARVNLDRLEPFVDAGAKVLVINPTCSMMLRREYPELVEPAQRERARRLADALQDPSEFLWSIRDEERFAGEAHFTGEARGAAEGSFAYHAPCHLRAQAKGFKGRDLIRKVLGLRPTTVMECCGHDGTYAMTVEGFEPSQRVGRKAFEGMREEADQPWVTDCPLAALQFEQFAGKKALHPMTMLARAYRNAPCVGAGAHAGAKGDAP